MVLISTRIRIRSLIWLLLIVATSGVVPYYGFGCSLEETGLSMFFASLFLIWNIVASLVANDHLMPRYAERVIARGFFKHIFEVGPHSERDPLAKNVCQKMVTNKLARLKLANNFFEGKDKKKTREYEDALWLAKFFRFSTDIPS